MKRSEAIEIVREYYPSSGKDLNEALETLIPELKESEDEIIRKALVELVRKHCVNETRCMMEEWLEKQRSRNLANSEKTCKDEPKFKVGDWVVYCGKTCKITGLNNGIFTITNQDGSYFFNQVKSTMEPVFHHWTIQDAKDGDVLSFNDGHGNDSIELIKSITDNKIEFWFCLTNGDRYEVFDGFIPYTNLVSREDATPATKEQCDFLFQEMHEAGYKWDAEKKELKQEEVDNLHNYLYGEQNPVWSEDDEANLQFAIDDFQFCVDNNQFPVVYNTEKHKEVLASLKSLKERYIWKPSNEQMSQLELIVQHDNFADQYQKEEIVTLFNDLKKLKG